MCTGDLFKARSLSAPRASWATPTWCFKKRAQLRAPLRKPQAPCSGVCAARVGGDTGPVRPARERSRNLSPGLYAPGRKPQRRRGRRGCPKCASPAGERVPGFYPSRAGLRGEGADLPILPARRPPRSSRRQPAAGCWSAGPPGPLQLSPGTAPRPSPPPARGPQAWSGVAHPQPAPTPGRASREGGDCGEGGREGRRPPPGAWSARGPRAARAARGLTVQRAAPGLGWLRSARGHQRMLAGFPGLGQRSRRGGPRVRL